MKRKALKNKEEVIFNNCSTASSEVLSTALVVSTAEPHHAQATTLCSASTQ